MHGTEVSLNFLNLIIYMRFEYRTDGYQDCALLLCDAMFGRWTLEFWWNLLACNPEDGGSTYIKI
jgi:hypothetical protein